MSKYNYTASFYFEITAGTKIADFNLSEANLQNLESLIPKQVDLKRNSDLLGVAFNAAVVNEFNKNGDGMCTKTAIDCVQQFVHKPTNIEHNKKKIVGHIVNAGFSDYSDSTILVNVDEDEKDPFNIALGAVVYKTVDKDFFDTISRSAQKASNLHKAVSASWEVGFSDYQIAVGSKNLRDAEIITDKAQIAKIKPMLKGFGGKGRLDDGTPIFRLICGTVYPLGIGYTMKPAANVKGVIADEEGLENIVKEKEQKTEAEKVIEINTKQSEQLEKVAAKISQSLKNTVNNNKIMDLENLLTELKSDLQEKKFSQEAIAGMTSTFADAIKTKDEEYKASLETAENEKAEIASANEELKNSVESIKEELATAQERIAEFEKAQAAVAAEATFNARMEEIDSIYDLEESDATFIAEKIKGLDSSEEAYASFKSELEVFWSSKNKEAKAKIEQEIKARVEEEVSARLKNEDYYAVEASEDVKVEDALDSAEATTTEIPNNNEAQASSTTLKDRFAAAFSRENITS